MVIAQWFGRSIFIILLNLHSSNFCLRKNLKLLIAYQKRFDKNYNKLYKVLNGEKPKNIYLKTRDHPLPPINYLKTSNGIVDDMMSHDIDIANLYMNFEEKD